MSAKRSVSVEILGTRYKVLTEGDEAFLHRVAGLVDETMRKVRERTGSVDSVGVAVLTALNLARELMALREASAQNTEAGDPKGLRQLIQLVESETAASAGASP